MCPCSPEAGPIASLPSRSHPLQEPMPLLAIAALSSDQVCPSAISTPSFQRSISVFWLENLRFPKPAVWGILAKLQMWVLPGGMAGGCSTPPAATPTLSKALPPPLIFLLVLDTDALLDFTIFLTIFMIELCYGCLFSTSGIFFAVGE